MFRQEKPVLPFNEISHLTGESLNFAINLRKKAALATKKATKPSPPPPVDIKRNTVDGKQVKDQYAVKETNCINSNCLNNNYTYAVEFQEVHFLIALYGIMLCY